MSSRSSTPSELASLPSHVAVGRLRRAHGVRGELWVEVLSDVPGRFDPGRELRLRSSEGPARTVAVVGSRPHKGGLLVRLEGVEDRKAAEGLCGSWLEVDREQVPEAPTDEYYHFELIGCRCVDRERGELGEVRGVSEGSGGELLQIVDGPRRVEVPFVAALVRSVDVATRRIELELPPGFLETCGSGW